MQESKDWRSLGIDLESIRDICRGTGCPACHSHQVAVLSVGARLVFACAACDSIGFVEFRDPPELN